MLNCIVLFYVVFASQIWSLFADEYVTYGSAIVLRHVKSKFKLYSTKMSWGLGSRQQIVTAVESPSYDENTLWVIKSRHVNNTGVTVLHSVEDQIQSNVTCAAGSPVKCGGIIRLEHMETEKNLHSHHQTAAISQKNFEVCGFGKGGLGNSEDDFKIECPVGETALKLGAPFNLRHVSSDGYLVTSKQFMFTQSNCPNCPIIGQQEVSVQRDGTKKAAKSELSQWKAETGLMLQRHEDDEDISSEETNDISGDREEL